MATAEELVAVVGSPVDSAAVRALLVADGLAASADPNLEEGEPRRAYLSSPAAGYQFMHHSGRVVTAFLYAEPAEGFVAFPNPLLGGLYQGLTFWAPVSDNLSDSCARKRAPVQSIRIWSHWVRVC